MILDVFGRTVGERMKKLIKKIQKLTKFGSHFLNEKYKSYPLCAK